MKKLTLTNELFEQLSTSEAFKTRGGSGNVNGVTGAPGSENNPIELDEVVITPSVGVKFQDTSEHIFGCPRCPKYGWGPNSMAGPSAELSYRLGVYFNHRNNH